MDLINIILYFIFLSKYRKKNPFVFYKTYFKIRGEILFSVRAFLNKTDRQTLSMFLLYLILRTLKLVLYIQHFELKR